MIDILEYTLHNYSTPEPMITFQTELAKTIDFGSFVSPKAIPQLRDTADVLEGLEKKGFIIMKIGKPIKYIAVQPEAVVERIKKRLQEDAEQQIQTVEKLAETDIFEELELLHKTGIKKIDVENITDSVVGRSNVNKFLKDMLSRAKKSVTVVTNEEGLKHKIKVLKKAKA